MTGQALTYFDEWCWFRQIDLESVPQQADQLQPCRLLLDVVVKCVAVEKSESDFLRVRRAKDQG
jgi:hypothetical protein